MAVMTRHAGGLKNSRFDGTDVPPPPMTMCTVPLVVSITSVTFATGTGVRVAFDVWPRIGCVLVSANHEIDAVFVEQWDPLLTDPEVCAVEHIGRRDGDLMHTHHDPVDIMIATRGS